MPRSSSSTMKGAQTSSQHGPAIDAWFADWAGTPPEKFGWKGINRAATSPAIGAGTNERNLRRSSNDMGGLGTHVSGGLHARGMRCKSARLTCRLPSWDGDGRRGGSCLISKRERNGNLFLSPVG